jgi:hypothetical protein
MNSATTAHRVRESTRLKNKNAALRAETRGERELVLGTAGVGAQLGPVF